MENESEQKKPFYKKWWFITIAVIVVLSAIFGSPEENKEKQTPINVAQPSQSQEKQLPPETQVAVKNNNPKESIIDIYQILGKSLSDVEKTLNSADKFEETSLSEASCEKNSCKKGFFQSGKYEIVFINDKSNLITIIPKEQYPLNEKSITLIGLSEVKPSFKNDSLVMRWENIGSIKEASFFDNGSGNIDYIYIKSN